MQVTLVLKSCYEITGLKEARDKNTKITEFKWIWQLNDLLYHPGAIGIYFERITELFVVYNYLENKEGCPSIGRQGIPQSVPQQVDRGYPSTSFQNTLWTERRPNSVRH